MPKYKNQKYCIITYSEIFNNECISVFSEWINAFLCSKDGKYTILMIRARIPLGESSLFLGENLESRLVYKRHWLYEYKDNRESYYLHKKMGGICSWERGRSIKEKVSGEKKESEKTNVSKMTWGWLCSLGWSGCGKKIASWENQSKNQPQGNLICIENISWSYHHGSAVSEPH